LINKYKDGVEIVAFRNQMKRICELAGINYELEKSRWWRKHHCHRIARYSLQQTPSGCLKDAGPILTKFLLIGMVVSSKELNLG
jgi:hypothetical protein